MARESENLPPYRRIAAAIIARIESGELQPGDSVPSVSEIMRTEGVSRATAARVPGVLRAEGYADAVPGVGTIVRTPRELTAGTARLGRLARTGQPYAPKETSTDHTAALRSCADPVIADQLGIEPHDEIVLRRRVFLQDGEPSIVALSCIHPRVLGPVPEVLQQGQLQPFWQHTYTERTGKQITRSPERLSARLASNDELEALAISAPTEPVALLVVQNTFHDDDGPIEVWQDAYAPGVWQVAGE